MMVLVLSIEQFEGAKRHGILTDEDVDSGNVVISDAVPFEEVEYRLEGE